jgi:metacaspase-1
MKKALLVGINDYPGTYNDLMGCVNDVQNMQNLLTSMFGFAAENIAMITDRQATTSNILKGLEALISGAHPGDLLIFHYSCHGSQVTDIEGDESDKLDEILCPYDLDWKSKMIRDDDLAKILEPLPSGVHVEIFLDSCHSGTGLKAVPSNNGSYRRARYLAPPEDLPKLTSLTPARITTIRPTKVRVLWAACRSTQYASDALIDGRYGGAFTTVLCNLIRQVNGSIPRKDLIKLLRAELKKAGFEQVPQLEGSTKPRKASFLST